MHPALQKIILKTGFPDIIEALTTRLSQGELNTLLLEVYRQKMSALTPAHLLTSLSQNRFISATELDPVHLRKFEIQVLEIANQAGFELKELGPVSPFGASSVYGKVNQNNVLTALRNCEVNADPSNLLCLLMVQNFAQSKQFQQHWACSHRTLRSAALNSPNQSPHFQLFAACSLLHRTTENEQLETAFRHLDLQVTLLRALGFEDIQFKIWLKSKQNQVGQAMLQTLKNSSDKSFELAQDSGSDYYQGFQIKTYVQIKQEMVEIADCGWVPWATELKSDKHLACFISGIGIERLLTLRANQAKE